MKRYAPNSLDLAPRDVVARAIEQEINEGRGFNDSYVHLDLRHLGADLIKERLPGIRQISMDFAGVDPIKESIPIQPGQHYSMGGIEVDINGCTSLSGLYAAGECSCVSVHGANRLGGNSLLETVVFGRLVANKIIKDIPNIKEAPEEPMQNATTEVHERIKNILERKNRENPFKIRDALTRTMSSKLGIFREADKMKEGLLEIKKMQKKISQYSISNKNMAVNQALVRFLELEYMLQLAQCVADGALKREESRGSHKRTDYPDRDDEKFLKHTITSLKDGKIRVSYKDVSLGIFEPKERVY